MKCRIAVISDIHFSHSPSTALARQTARGAILLRQTVRRLNQFFKPDVVVVLGDLIDEPNATDAAELLGELRGILDRLACPWLAIPGNHDPHPDAFFKVFSRVDHLDVNGVRLVAFVDDEEPGYNASRNSAGLKQMVSAANGHHGPLVALQHVPVGEPNRELPYGYTNYADVHNAMRTHGYSLAISGHYHAGQPLMFRDGVSNIVIPALCEVPFTFAIVTIDGGNMLSELHHCELASDADSMGAQREIQ